MTITLEQVEAEVRTLAAAQPDFVYPFVGAESMCYYTKKGFRRDFGDNVQVYRCIIGEALHRLGIGEDVLIRFEGERAHCVFQVLLGSDLKDETGMWLDKVQEVQDTWSTWSVAVETADEWMSVFK